MHHDAAPVNPYDGSFSGNISAVGDIRTKQLPFETVMIEARQALRPVDHL